MAEQNSQIQDPEQVKAAEENERFKKRLKDEYGIEDDVETFKEKRSKWQRAEEELPKYQATLNAVVEHYRNVEEQIAAKPVKTDSSDDSEEEKLRTIAKLDPYEGVKRFFAKKEKEFDEKIQRTREESHQVAEGATLRRETMRRSRDIVEANWPEAFDQKSELFQVGSRIFNQEMSEEEKRDPRAFLIATERAAGRVGLPPKSKRKTSSVKRADVAAQGVSRQGSSSSADDEHEAPLTARQKKIIDGLGVDEKTYRLARKNRKEQGTKKEDDD